MRRPIIYAILLIAIPFYSNAQTVVGMSGDSLLIRADQYLGKMDEILVVQREVNHVIQDIGKVRLILWQSGTVKAQIIEEFHPFHIEEGDFVKPAATSGYVNAIDDMFMNEIQSQKEPAQTVTQGKEIRLRKKKRIETVEDFYKWRIGFDYGYAYRTAKMSGSVPSDFKDYMNDLRSGSDLTMEIAYFFSKGYGIGLKYSVFNSSNQMNNLYLTYLPTGELVKYGSIKDDIKIMLLGPGFYERLISKDKKTCIIAGVILGYMDYKDDFELLGEEIQITGKTIGLSVSFGAEYLFNLHFAVGMSVSYFIGSLHSMEYDGIKYDLDDPENLNYLNLNCGIRFLI